MKKTTIKLTLACLGILACSAQASITNFAATLESGAEPFPIEPSVGFGSAAMTLDTETGEFAWVIGFEDLTGPATLAHFHVAPAGVSGPVVLNLATDPGAALSGIGAAEGIFSGSTLLDWTQIEELSSGLWYINIHTDLNPAGEIRGQVYPGEFVPAPVPVPASLVLLVSGMLGLVTVTRSRTTSMTWIAN